MNPAPIGELAVRAGLLPPAKLTEVLAYQRQRFQQGDFRRAGELIAEFARCGRAPIRQLLAQQGVTIVACELCGTRYTGLRYQGQKPCLRCGRALKPTDPDDPLATEDAITDPGPQGDQLLMAYLQRSIPVGRYRLLGEIARGGMGVVYKAWEPERQRYVALKFIKKPDAAQWEDEVRFRREAQVLMQLKHPNIVRGHALEEPPGLIYMAMEFVPGVPLDLLVEHGLLGEVQLVKICAQVASALHYAHDAGLIHRDVKPGNVVVDASAKAFLVDFGIMKSAEESMSLTAEGEVLGSLAFMAPGTVTQGIEALDAKADVYGLGIVLYQVLTAGGHPYGDPETEDFVMRLVKEAPKPVRQNNPRIPKALGEVIDRAIAKSPGKRFETADELRQALEQFLASGVEFGADAPDAPEGPGVLGRLKRFLGSNEQ